MGARIFTSCTPEDSEPLSFLSIPERNLIAAILERAIADYALECQSNEPMRYAKRMGYVTAAQAWIWPAERDGDPKETVFSFVWCCRMLALDPHHIRGILKERFEYADAARLSPESSRSFKRSRISSVVRSTRSFS